MIGEQVIEEADMQENKQAGRGDEILAHIVLCLIIYLALYTIVVSV